MSFPQTQLSNNIQSSILLKFIPDFEGSRTVEKECGLSPLNELTLTASAVKRQFGTFMNPEDFEEVYGEFSLLFEHIPTLSEVFALKEQHIEFNPSLTEYDIQEIYEYVRVSKVIHPENVTRYYGVEK